MFDALAYRSNFFMNSTDSPSIFVAHMLNVRLLLEHGARGADRIVLMPGNAVLFRPCRPLLLAAPLSFMPGQTFSDLTTRDPVPIAAAPAPAVQPRAPVPAGAPRPCSPPCGSAARPSHRHARARNVKQIISPP